MSATCHPMVLKLLSTGGRERNVTKGAASECYAVPYWSGEFTGVSVPSNRGIVGVRLLQRCSEPTFLSHVAIISPTRRYRGFPVPAWEMVDQSGPNIVLGKASGLDSIMIWLDKLGFPPAKDEQSIAILQEVKATSLLQKWPPERGRLQQDRPGYIEGAWAKALATHVVAY